MKEIAIHEFDERLQKQIAQAREALGRGGIDYVIQVCGELLKHHPGAYELRALLWEALRADNSGKSTRMKWLRGKSSGVQFKLSTRSLIKKEPIELIRRCDEKLRAKHVFPELFSAIDKVAEQLEWLETRVMACRALTELQPDKAAPRLALAEVLLEVKRPQEAIEHVEWVLAREPSNSEAQTLLKNASVAETLQRGNWEDTDTTFHTKKHN